MATQIIEDYRAMLDAVLTDAETSFSHLIFYEPQLVTAAVYMTVIQSSMECAMLLKQPTVTAGGVLRSIFESYADLRALITDILYSKRMLATFHKEEARLYGDMNRDPANPYHADLARKLDPVVGYDRASKKLAELRAEGSLPLGSDDRLKAAGLEHEYRSLYWQLCLESHNNISAIERRHVEKTAQGISLEFRRDNRTGELLKYYDSLVSVVIDATQRIHQYTGSPAIAQWQAWRNRLTEFREKNAVGTAVQPSPAPAAVP